jgi:hypothetical protein
MSNSFLLVRKNHRTKKRKLPRQRVGYPNTPDVKPLVLPDQAIACVRTPRILNCDFEVFMTPKIKRFIKDSKGRKVSVVLPIEDFRKIQKELEELESIRAYDAAKASGDVAIPFQQAVSEKDRSRKQTYRWRPAGSYDLVECHVE